MNDKKSCENDWQEGKSSRECQEYMLEKQVSDSTHCKNLSLKISREIDDTCSSGVDFFGCFLDSINVEKSSQLGRYDFELLHNQYHNE